MSKTIILKGRKIVGGKTRGEAGTADRQTLGGSFQSGSANPYNFNGLVDQVYMYNRFLTSDERTTLYNSGSGV